jgi:eukaryotic-like serine/threonine-protein kinase
MGVKDAPKASDFGSGSFPAGEPTSFAVQAQPEGLKVVTLAPGTVSEPDLEGGNALDSARRSDPYLGCTIDGRYKVEAMLGEGGMGVVYRCSHKIIGKKVAMKVLRSDLARDSEATERFLNEAKAASSIGNPHIIDISDFGQFPDGSTYFVMEFLEGLPLSAALVDGEPMPVRRIISIAEQLAEGLAAAHQGKIVHRDLKPDNIFLIARGQNKDFVKILDFGIAKVSTAEGKLTRAGAVFGTPHYMSPEQAAGTPVDHRGDIYSFGVILYELASGRVPFDADNFMGILTQHMYKSPVPIRALVPQPQEVPPGLEAIILKCLSKRPEQRYASMEEVLVDLEQLKGGGVPDAVADMMSRSGSFNVPQDYFRKTGGMPAPLPATPMHLVRARWPWIAGALGVLAVVSLVAAIFARSGAAPVQPLSAENAAAIQQRNTPAEREPEVTVLPAEMPPVTRQVVLAVEPIDAHVFRGESDLGQSPVLVDIKEGEQAILEIKREGFETQKVVLDGSEGRRSIKLTAEAQKPVPARQSPVRPKAKPPVRPNAAPKPSIGSSEIINPWG